MTSRVLVCCSLVLAGLAYAGVFPDSFTILPASQGQAVLRQCSRGAPTSVSGFWQVSPSQVFEMERRLPEFLRRSGHRIETTNYFRQYIGIVSHGRKLIYLNAFIRGALTVSPRLNWKTTAFTARDGGDGFWGVEYDPVDKTFRHFESNGVA
jgi:hypothetical protein